MLKNNANNKFAEVLSRCETHRVAFDVEKFVNSINF